MFKKQETVVVNPLVPWDHYFVIALSFPNIASNMLWMGLSCLKSGYGGLRCASYANFFFWFGAGKLSKYLCTKILQIPQNTSNTYQYSTCHVRYILCFEFFCLVFLFWDSRSSSISVYIFQSRSIAQLLSYFIVQIY